jgi:hypothetical protein
VDPVPDPLLLTKSGTARKRTRDLWVCREKAWPLNPPKTLRNTFYINRALAMGFWPLRPGFEHSSSHVGFVVNKATLESGSLRVLFSPMRIITPTAPRSSCAIRGWYNRQKIGQRAKWTQSQSIPKKLKTNFGNYIYFRLHVTDRARPHMFVFHFYCGVDIYFIASKLKGQFLPQSISLLVKITPWLLVRKWTLPTERPLLVGEF